ncbi:hypothetical protein EOA60_00170 [Mesorhizobium sp. M1A.F.Ca.IN.020.06.1.1]|uniref:hypothetical protein n=1 Tax=unclassified Mesorhizobium TaxID=325217 RepID=UPI000FCAA737|nr:MULTISPECIES: hypothetical protein [unclassified Mesorhizobium]RUV07820.1 hypothetical protein EOA79_03210 [Mesorhizobium sp. M1A.F.Ca.IN.020.03.2.1]RUV88829.1 hypothetical protein EOA51_05775 [Mesorhizobium sp. M1A.F.Ca.IN.020.32.1.1]RUW13152.1 hypothetical protein EOA46_07230 [Mesorhizobium sp. M1A.F.Ca.IN.022.05.2.1]RUW37924.1 hypothetical protein EOA60_00170 [Mesorhizobium sp. M1A.F.Ca.IN.020.06.1.1]RWF83630.1 MAG: hypothetical protein EOQ35_05865 [Mesorhizobium sp.]
MSEHDPRKAACKGAATRSTRCGMDHMEECRACHMEVDWDLMNHPFIGFKASCGYIPFTPDHNEETYPCLTK